MLNETFVKECAVTARQRRKSRPEGKLARCLRSVERYMKKHGHLDAKGVKVVSQKTRITRRKVLRLLINLLHQQLHLPIVDLRGLRPKHIEKAIQHWEAEGHCAATLQNYLSVIRTAAEWIGKPGMVLGLEDYLVDPSRAKRKYATDTLQGPEQNGIDIRPRLLIVLKEEPRMLVQLLLAAAFGVRCQEAMLMCPHLADKEHYIDVNRGAKSGRDRTTKIRADFQRAVIDLAKEYADEGCSTIPKQYSLKRWLNRWKTVVSRKAGLNKANGCNPHRLRHGYAAMLYEAITGHPPLISGQVLPEDFDPAKDRLARLEVAEDLGHSRLNVSSAYIGAMSVCDFSDAPIKKQGDEEGNDGKPVDKKERTSLSGDDDT